MSEPNNRPVYTAARIQGKPDWESLPSAPVDRVLWTEDAGVRARGQLCFDRQNLYIHMSAAEEEIRAEYTAPGSPVHEDSCLEFFFLPAGGDRYFNFEVNPNGCLHAQLGTGRNSRTELAGEDAKAFFDIRTGRTEDGWEVFYRIPLEFIRRYYPDFSFEGEMTANLYKCGDKTVKPHYLSWSPVELDTPDFHRPEFFGRIRFGE